MLFGIIALMRNPPYGLSSGALRPFRAKATGEDAKEGGCFGEFCAYDCKYRFFCMRKRAAHEKGTCLEYELTSHRLW